MHVPFLITYAADPPERWLKGYVPLVCDAVGARDRDTDTPSTPATLRDRTERDRGRDAATAR
jgi:hypothetical protein